MSDFTVQHDLMVARELPHARRDSERMAELVSALTEALALAIAIGARGVPDQINKLCEGTSARLFEGAAEKADVARWMSGRAN